MLQSPPFLPVRLECNCHICQVLSLPEVDYVEEDGVVHTARVGSWGLDRVNQRDGRDGSYSCNPSYSKKTHIIGK